MISQPDGQKGALLSHVIFVVVVVVPRLRFRPHLYSSSAICPL